MVEGNPEIYHDLRISVRTSWNRRYGSRFLIWSTKDVRKWNNEHRLVAFINAQSILATQNNRLWRRLRQLCFPKSAIWCFHTINQLECGRQHLWKMSKGVDTLWYFVDGEVLLALPSSCGSVHHPMKLRVIQRPKLVPGYYTPVSWLHKNSCK